MPAVGALTNSLLVDINNLLGGLLRDRSSLTAAKPSITD